MDRTDKKKLETKKKSKKLHSRFLGRWVLGIQFDFFSRSCISSSFFISVSFIRIGFNHHASINQTAKRGKKQEIKQSQIKML